MMLTRRRRVNYRLLNDGIDEDLSEDYGVEPMINAPFLAAGSQEGTVGSVDTSDCELLSSESASQPLALNEKPPVSEPSAGLHDPFRRTYHQRPAPVTEWLWAYFKTTVVDRECVLKRTNKRKLTDRDIHCAYVDDKTGIRCGWKSADSLRQNATSNMRIHLAKHSIYHPS